ncbi:MAG: threonine synthase [Halorhodospira halophila]|uniref:threonine synthase n=1 Tax=Halorhodospira TaxID=85108 RepID=UPI001912D100|nr:MULTISPECIES: threonine synthase [Halorhodospira]MBK5937615.1 threonine synthase [Halorhodospira halophila]MBK5942454.1 threonine synthase [Halorhodospira halophila]MCC3750644.1 threonine synthase [Halorhodospira halophila]MCG5528235.1 threonine synthase [Halorhodospira halophila]MCG5532004.1 threonine synthase [Halorhodospira sp. 9621]
MPFRPRYTGLIAKYLDRLPISDDARILGLGEGNTPLIQLTRIPAELGRDVDLYVKFEGLNPTGSFKDRGMTMAVTKAVEQGAKAIICASTGNTSASAAAYAARAGISCFVLIPDGKIAMGKLAQAIMHGAQVLQIRGNFDAGMRLVKELAEHAPLTIVNSINPYRLQGQKTAAFEVIEELERAPDYHCLPVGNAGNITAHWIGYSECAGRKGDEQLTAACAFCEGHCRYASALVDRRPRMVGYQASGSAPFLRGGPVAEPETVATAIRIGDPQSWDYAQAVREESGGWFDELSDEEILRAQRMLADHEGVFCEPASATSVAGAMRDIRSGRIPEGSTVVCTLTGHGLKDPDVASAQAGDAVQTVDADYEAVREAILKRL